MTDPQLYLWCILRKDTAISFHFSANKLSSAVMISKQRGIKHSSQYFSKQSWVSDTPTLFFSTELLFSSGSALGHKLCICLNSCQFIHCCTTHDLVLFNTQKGFVFIITHWLTKEKFLSSTDKLKIESQTKDGIWPGNSHIHFQFQKTRRRYWRSFLNKLRVSNLWACPTHSSLSEGY